MKKLFYAMIFSVVLLAGSICVCHADALLGFDDKAMYDIYFDNGGGKIQSVRDVAIVGLRQIGVKSFILIENSRFKVSDVRGYISLDAITAILPTDVFQARSE